MNTISKTLLCACIAFAANASFAAAAAGGKDNSKGDMKKDMTMQECKDHMAMSKKDGMKKDDAMMAKDHTCNDMMKNSMGKDGMMKKDGAASAPMTK